MSPVPSLVQELTAACVATRSVFAAAACSCALATEAGDELEFVAADGAGAANVIGLRLPVSRGIAGFTALSGQAMAIADVATDQRFARDVAESTDYVPTTILAAPLLDADGDTLGVMEVLDPTSRGGSGVLGLEVLTTIADRVAAVVRLSRRAETSLDPALAAALAEVAATGPSGVRLARDLLAAAVAHARGGR